MDVFFVFQINQDFPSDRRFAGILNKSNHSNESNKSNTLRGALVCDGANTLTVAAPVVFRAVVAATKVQAKSAVGVGVRRTERTRPVVAELTHEVRISTVAPASSREEDTIAVRTGNLITFMSTLGCPGPIALITEFFKLCAGRHAPCAAPFLTGGVVTAGRADARLAVILVDAPTVMCAVKAVIPIVT